MSERNELLMVSVACSDSYLKTISAILHSNNVAVNVKCERPYPDFQPTFYRDYKGFSRDGSGYSIYKKALAYRDWHGLAITKHQSFMPELTPETLWDRLSGDEFTTPLLPEWTEYLLGALKAQESIRLVPSIGCCSALCTVNDEGLDKVVREGLKQGLIQIPGARKPVTRKKKVQRV